jgi:hypothetical protein
VRLRESQLLARFTQEHQVREQQERRHAPSVIEQRAPAEAVLDQHAHGLARGRIADQVADAEHADDRAVRGVVEPFRGHLDESRPGERLRQAVADPREREQRDRGTGSEQQRKERRAYEADQKIDSTAPEIAESGQEQLAERVREHAHRGDRADAHDGLVVAHALPAQFVDDHRRRDRQVGAAEIQGRIAAEQQQDRGDLQ